MRITSSLFLSTLALVGCGPHATSGAGGSTTSDPCVENPASCMGTCTGQCAPDAPGFAEDMVQVWSGPIGSTPPACPAGAPVPTSGYLDAPPDSVTCSPACTCGSSQDECFLPGTLTVSAAACPGGSATSLDPPAAWGGSCVTQASAASVASFTVGPTGFAFKGGSCAPSSVAATNVEGGKAVAQLCTTTNNPPIPTGQCPNGSICAFERVEGHLLCLLDVSGDVSCPAGWPSKHLYYDHSALCACSCGAPTGESCTSTVTAYDDAACQNPLGSAAVSADQSAACVDVAPGSMLGSVSATPPVFKSGTCAPVLTKSQPWTLCCLP